ncbi:MAG: hypothetical protein ACR2MA_12050 [Egibacteraceae bacterium]
METKRCSRCGTTKPIDEFPLRRRDTGKRQPYCRSCKAVYQRDWYERNRDRHIADVQRNRQRRIIDNRTIIAAAKDRPCVDCGVRFPPFVLDFDHVKESKDGNVSEMVRHVSPRVLLTEIAKCDVVCANCHRWRTYGGDRSKRSL